MLTPASLEAAFVGFQVQFAQFFEETPTYMDGVYTEYNSTDESENYPFPSRNMKLQPSAGETEFRDFALRNQNLKNQVFTEGFKIKRTVFDDDKHGIYAQPLLRQLAEAAKLWKDQQITAALAAGTTAPVFDGQAFFSANHPQDMDNPASAVFSNNFVNQTIDSTHIAAVRAAMIQYAGENGVPFGLIPDTLIVPAGLEFQVRNIVDPTFYGVAVGSAAASQENIIKKNNWFKSIIVNPYLTDQTSLYMACTTRAVKPLIFQTRDPAEFSYLNTPNAYSAFENEEYKFKARGRGAAGYGHWAAMARITTSGS